MIEITEQNNRLSQIDPTFSIARLNRRNISTKNESDVVKEESKHLPMPKSTKYSKKFPISFIASKDWHLYIHFSGKFRTRGQIRLKNRTHRLINAFLQLYKEYEHVCDDILPSIQTQDSSQQKIDDRCFNSNQHFQELERVSQSSVNLEGTHFGEFPDITNYEDYNSSQIKGWVLNKLRSVRSKKYNCTIPYDKIEPYQHETIEIYLNERKQKLVSHKISFTGFDSMGHPMIKWIDVPIALELLIPKVQSKIQRVMSSCHFLYDPLEVAAELRYFNYSVEMCINHFHQTRKFRDILGQFVPQKSQLKQLEAYPQLLQRFQVFFDKMNNEQMIKLKYDKGSMFDNNAANNHTTENFVQFNKGDSLILKEPEKRNGEPNYSLITSKFAKIVSFLNKLKLTQIDFSRLMNKWKAKYNKEIEEYSKIVYHSIESFKDLVMTEEQRGRILHLLRQNEELKLKLKEEEMKRKNMHNMMQDQLGNVRVYCRCRAVDKHPNVLDIKTNDTVTLQIGFCEEFKFDKVFDSFRTQSDIYEELQPLILSFIDGFNVCFITYGGEASGKTYTLLGPVYITSGSEDVEKHDGIMKRALREVLSEETSRRRDWEYHLTGSVVEIYNDTFTDILTDKSGMHLPIDGGLEKVQEALKTMSIKSESDIETLVKVCKVKRKVGRTALNHHSSRSHLIIIIHLTGRSKIHGERISSFLGLCDLAGFEDILKAETHDNRILSKEAGYINKSLTAFNRMFTSLRQQDPNYVSYRDTRLTYLLKPFLINQSKCILIVTVRTDKSSISSTQSTLRFGRETRGVALGKPKRQMN